MTYFYDKLDKDKRWQSTLIDVTEKTTPFYRLYTGNSRFKLSASKPNFEQTLFWGTVCPHYEGAWLLRNNQENLQQLWQYPPIRPINSIDIESYKQNIPLENKTLHYFNYFANLFAKLLIKSDFGILNQGNWQISQGYFATEEYTKLTTESIRLMKEDSIFRPQLSYINWMTNGSNELIALKDRPREDSARVKWWRKKVKENSCPPVLAWFINSLDAFIIIDGHSRLVAFELEQKPVQILIITQFRKASIKEEDWVIQSRLDSLKSLKYKLAYQEKNNYEPSIDEINSTLIRIYDHKLSPKFITIGKHLPNMEDLWLKEVSTFFENDSINREELHSMIEREPK